MPFEPIENYILREREERQAHLRLEESCIEIGGYDSREYRGLLAHHLGTTIPTKKKIVLCHACNNHKCSNPRHLYWGTYSENNRDAIDNGKKSAYAYIVEKHGLEVAKQMMRDRGAKGGKSAKHKSPKSPEHRQKIREAITRWHQSRQAEQGARTCLLSSD